MKITSPCRKKIFLFLTYALLIVSFLHAQKKILSPEEKAVELLKKNITVSGLNQSLLNAFRVSNAYQDRRSGDFLVYLQQTHLGIPVYNKISVYVFKDDTLLHRQSGFLKRIPDVAGTRTAGYRITPVQAISLAAGHVAIPVKQTPQVLRKDDVHKRFVYKVEGLGTDSTTAELVWFPQNDGRELKLAWNVRVASPDKHADWFVRIDAQTGEYLDQNSLVVSEEAESCPETDNISAQSPLVLVTASSSRRFTTAFAPPAVASASYRVYPFPLESPNYSSRVLETDPWLKAGAGNNAITLGWHFDNTVNYDLTRGNNVWAQEDKVGTSDTTGLTDNSSTAIPALTFDQVLDPSMNPSAGSNLRAGIDNLFYWNNLMHDISYQYGFDEAAGNFQENNIGRGGMGNDFVNAFAEDGSGLNNANFFTPPDGENPRMRMYQFTQDVISSFHVNNPSAIAGDYAIVQSSINLNGQLAYTGTKTAGIIPLNDAGATHLGCGTITNAASLAGNIALIDRGSCAFDQKILNAQNAGAIAVIVVNNVAGPATGMGRNNASYDAAITIPAVMISMADGATLNANLAGLNGTLSSAGLLRDGSLDNGVISHEYTHGISNRLTGGSANVGCLVNAEQMGEGWSDYVALMVTTNWSTAAPADGINKRPLGTYVFSQPASGGGIRTYPYSTDMSVDPWTYGMMAGVGGGEIHTLGEIWCSAIWDMTWNIIQQEGIDPDIYHGTKGNNIALQLVIQAMKYQPCSPGFLDGRDAILKADSILYQYAHKCAIWNAFARRGMGKSASQGSSASYTDQVAATDLPLGLGLSKTADKASFAGGDNIIYTIKAQCDCGALTNISVIDTLSANLAYIASSGGTYTAPAVHFDGISFASGETKTFTIQAAVSGSYTAPLTLINDSRDPANYAWTTGFITGGSNWVESAARSHSSSHAWFATDQSTPTDFQLISGDLLPDTISTLSFWHYFESDPAFDGGLVEISTDGGSSWKDLGPYMIQNGYNSSFDPSTGAVGNRPCFSGSSGGAFIQTVVSLTGFAGTTARIRFRFSSDELVGGEGWYIDDILMKNEKGIVNKAFAYNGASLLANNKTVGLFAAAALPVHFINFEAQRQYQTAVLHWKVSEEINVDKYVVERSADGRNFVAAGEVAHSSISSNEKDYYFTDKQPVQGNNYYRIAEKDIDGRTARSVTRLLRFGDGITVMLLPVPSYNHTVQLDIQSANSGSFTAYLLTVAGQIVKSYKVQTGINQLSLENFAKGVYYLKVQLDGGQVEVRKLVIE